MSGPDSLGPLLAAMESRLARQGRVTLAIDGQCGSGKTTLAAWLAERFDGNVFHADDFYLPLRKRTPRRLAEIGGFMERERLREEVLSRLREDASFSYGVFDHRSMDVGPRAQVSPKAVNIVEGAYCMHPELRGFYDLSLFLGIDPRLQEERILARNGPEKLIRFREEWIPRENAYIAAMAVEEACDFRLSAEELDFALT